MAYRRECRFKEGMQLTSPIMQIAGNLQMPFICKSHNVTAQLFKDISLVMA